MNPPKDGTLIFATGNIICEICANEFEMDAPAIGVLAEPFYGAMYWDFYTQLWLWHGNGLSVKLCISDEIYFHWWTALEGGCQ